MGEGYGDDAGEFDPETQTYRLYHDWGSSTRLSTEIILAVAALTDTPANEIGPLYEIVNPDALDHLFPPVESRGQTESTLRFTLNECDVTVYSQGVVEIQLPSDR